MHKLPRIIKFTEKYTCDSRCYHVVHSSFIRLPLKKKCF